MQTARPLLAESPAPRAVARTVELLVIRSGAYEHICVLAYMEQINLRADHMQCKSYSYTQMRACTPMRVHTPAARMGMQQRTHP
jgi:hypothetical protein